MPLAARWGRQIRVGKYVLLLVLVILGRRVVKG